MVHSLFPRYGLVILLATLAVRAQVSPPTRDEGQEVRNRERVRLHDAWFRRGRRGRGAISGAELRLRAWEQTQRVGGGPGAGASPLEIGTSGEWTPLGPSPLASDASGVGFHDYNWVSGRATSIAIDASDPSGNTVYVGGAYGGLWKSINAAAPLPGSVAWTPLLDDQPTLAVGAVALRPGAPATVLVGTGETNGASDSYYGLGVLRSTNGGNSWTLIGSSVEGYSFRGMGFSKIAFSTDNPALVVAGTGFATQGAMSGLESGAHRGIYASSDAGAAWQYASIKDGANAITSSSVTSVVYNPTAHRFLAAIRRHGFYSSTDGLTWTRLVSQPGPATGPGALTTAACPPDAQSNLLRCPIYRAEIAVVPGRDEVYVWFIDLPGNGPPVTDGGIWRSVNGGPWTQISPDGFQDCGEALGCGSQQADYNMAIAAVANGSRATDLYVGAVNLFKCALGDGGTSTTCGGAWLNLTHAFGCSEIARVHPNQHAIQFAVASGRAIGYFANDGGLYRTLDGFLGLSAGAGGSCDGTNQFDSLNETLGSMTQFVSLSQDPTDPGILIGGTQNNGTAATAQAMASSSFVSVLGGDGGFTAITAGAPSRWFVSGPDTPPGGLEIDSCDGGIHCRSSDLYAVAGSSDLDGDDGGFYFPYILDPQHEGQLLIGTCRIWRAAVNGSSFTQLGSNFDTGSGSCNGSEVNQVRGLAAGGPAGSHGFSNVVYATTDGEGPFASSTGAVGGRVFVSINADSASPQFSDVTGSLNAEQFPISSVTIDSSDPSGRTAFISVMGFGVTHVFKTVNAGTSWAPFGSQGSGLPDAPANFVLADAEAAKVYVGTDIGVFVSPSSAPSWQRVGVASGRGHLPSVPVSSIAIFRPDAGTKKLRASTYGRGLWEYDLVASPDFRVSLSATTMNGFNTQQVAFAGTLTAVNGYGSQVTLSCQGASRPSTCLVSPTTLTPTREGAAFTVTTADAPGTYPFSIRARGADALAITHDIMATLKVVDFAISTPSPNSVSAIRPGLSEPTRVSASVAGPFDGHVALSCTGGLPAGSECNFSPSATTSPRDGSPSTATLTISTSALTPLGTFPVTISASADGAPANKTTSVTLVVSAAPDYTLTIDNTPLSAAVGQETTFSGTLTSLNEYNYGVAIACGPGAPPTCVGGSFTPTASGTPFHVRVSSATASAYDFAIQGTGSDPAHREHSTVVKFDATSEFSMGSDSGAQTVTAGGTAAYVLHIVPGGSTFSNEVTFSCSPATLPSLARCTFSPTTVAAGTGAANVNLRISTTAPIAGLQRRMHLEFYASLLPLMGLAFLFGAPRVGRQKKRAFARLSVGAAALMACVSLVACGGGGNDGGGGHPGTPPGSYAIRVFAASGSQTQQLTVNLTVQ